MMTKIILLTLWTYYSATRYRRPCRPPHYLPPTVAAALLRLHRPRNAAGLVTSPIYLIESTTSRSYPRGNIEIITSLLRMIVTTDTAPPPPLLPSSSHPRRRAVLPFFPPWRTATPVANLHQPQPPRPRQRWQRHAPPHLTQIAVSSCQCATSRVVSGPKGRWADAKKLPSWLRRWCRYAVAVGVGSAVTWHWARECVVTHWGLDNLSRRWGVLLCHKSKMCAIGCLCVGVEFLFNNFDSRIPFSCSCPLTHSACATCHGLKWGMFSGIKYTDSNVDNDYIWNVIL